MCSKLSDYRSNNTTVEFCCREGSREYRITFKDSNTRSVWEKDLLSAKLNFETVMMNKLPPEFIDRIQVERSRAGMQVCS